MMNCRSIILVSILGLSSNLALAGLLEDGFQAFSAGNYEQAFESWVKLAKENNADAKYNLGILYMKGLGVNKDEKIAFDLFKSAANQGNSDAMYNLGIMYNKGRVVTRSSKDAVKWWDRASKKGNPYAQFNLGVQYAYGRVINKGINDALNLWMRAAQQGHNDARAALYRVYNEGMFGIEKNPEQAKLWQ